MINSLVFLIKDQVTVKWLCVDPSFLLLWDRHQYCQAFSAGSPGSTPPRVCPPTGTLDEAPFLALQPLQASLLFRHLLGSFWNCCCLPCWCHQSCLGVEKGSSPSSIYGFVFGSQGALSVFLHWLEWNTFDSDSMSFFFLFILFSLSVVSNFVTLWTAARQASLSFTVSLSLLIESLMPSNHLILCRPLLLLPSIFPSIRVFSNELTLPIRWPKYWSFSYSISPSNDYLDWLKPFQTEPQAVLIFSDFSWFYPIEIRAGLYLPSLLSAWGLNTLMLDFMQSHLKFTSCFLKSPRIHSKYLPTKSQCSTDVYLNEWMIWWNIAVK